MDVLEQIKATTCRATQDFDGKDEILRRAATEIERIRADYERLARHIAPDVEAEYIWSHLPEQIIDAGLQLQEAALSEARATGYREAYELRMKKFRSGCSCHMNDSDEIVSMCQHHEALIAEARATGRRRGMEWSARYHEKVVTRIRNDPDSYKGDSMRPTYKRASNIHEYSAAAIRAAMEKAAGDPPVETKDIGERHGDHH